MSRQPTAEEYQQLTQIEHVLLRPDMYIGPIQRIKRKAKCYDPTTKRIVEKEVQHSEGEEQIWKELAGNGADNVWRSLQLGIDPGVIECEVTPELSSIKNYGRHIAIDINQKTGKWVPDMIFGNLLSGSNFDDTVERLYIGKNGIGAKATNIFSKFFMVECADPDRQLLYRQVWQNNMSVRGEPEIVPYQGPGYTKVSYSPDFSRFGVTCFDQEALEIYGAHAAFISYSCKIPVYFNGELIRVENLEALARMFFPIDKMNTISFSDPDGHYDLCLIETPDAGINVSFVNGMITENGGAHVDAAYRVIVHNIIEFLGKSVEGIKLTKKDIVNHVSVFISCRVNKPIFKSQVKDCLVRPEPKIDLPDKLLKGIRKWQLIEFIYKEIERKQNQKMNKEVGNKKKKGYWGKAEPANLAGTSRSSECTYILTEGDSADAYRLKFISQVPGGMGRQFYGSQPLRGKLPNALNADFIQILDNEELMAICKNISLKPDIDYRDPANYKKLHYGRLLIFPDPDNDGKHILGLVLLFFLVKFPTLVMLGYINFLRIPVVRANVAGQRLVFYSTSAYARFMASLPSGTRVTDVEYFKGLGSSEDHHIKEDFANPRIVTFKMDEKTIERTLLAFHGSNADQRKVWIDQWVNRDYIEVEKIQELPISTFIDHELIDYSIENIIRSIPEAIDGMKESQRKAFFAALKLLRGKKKADKMKTAQIASHAAQITNYKHGEGCLADTMVRMTQSFVGSNNLEYFQGRGQFGTRNKGGQDAANPRYTHISLPYWTDLVYRKEDRRLEKLIVDADEKQECENFYPILPMHVINGSKGIGTGYSTTIPPHKPTDVAFWIQEKIMMDLDPKGNHYLPRLSPWYRGFTGEIEVNEDSYITKGIMRQTPDAVVHIEELPIGTWTNDYEMYLRKLEDEGAISGLDTYSTDSKVNFVIKNYNQDKSPNLKKLRLISRHSYRNMTVLYRTADRGIRPQIYSNLNDLLNDWYKMRVEKYLERKNLILGEINTQIMELTERARFIHEVAVSKRLEIRDRKEAEIKADMDQLKLDHKWLDDVKTRELNKDRIPVLQAKIAEKLAEKTQLEQTRHEQMMYAELEEFIQAYCKHEKCERSSHQTIAPIVTLSI